MDILFFGFIADDLTLQEAMREPAPQVSAIKFQKPLIRGLAKGSSVRIVSTVPIASFPRNRNLWIKGGYFSLEAGPRGRLIPILNLPLFKLIFRFVGGLAVGWQACRVRCPDVILVYAVHTPFIAAAALLSRIFQVPFAVFVPDLPLHMIGKAEHGFRGWLKEIDNRLLQRLTKRACVAFPVTQAIADDWLPQEVPRVVIEGIAPELSPLKKDPPGPGRKRLLYAGTFTQIARFARLFSERPEIDADLVFVGSGPQERELRLIAAKDSRITIKPFMDEESLTKEMEVADILLNPRDPRWEGARYSFPSKLLDYIARGMPIASTRMPGIPSEYFAIFFEIDDTDAERLSLSLMNLISADSEEYTRRVERGLDILINSKSAIAVAERVIKSVPAC